MSIWGGVDLGLARSLAAEYQGALLSVTKLVNKVITTIFSSHIDNHHNIFDSLCKNQINNGQNEHFHNFRDTIELLRRLKFACCVPGVNMGGGVDLGLERGPAAACQGAPRGRPTA